MLRTNKVALFLFGLSVVASFCGSLTIQTGVHQHSHATFGHHHGDAYHSHSHPEMKSSTRESPFEKYRRAKAAEGKAEGIKSANDSRATDVAVPHIHFVFLGFEFSWILHQYTDVPQFCGASTRLSHSFLLARKLKSIDVLVSDGAEGKIPGEFPWMFSESNRRRLPVAEVGRADIPNDVYPVLLSLEPNTPPPRASCYLV